MAVTIAELEALRKGTLKHKTGPRKGELVEWLPDDTGRGSGRLLFRAVGGVVRGYFRYSPVPGKRDTLAIAQWDKAGKDGLTLGEIRNKADEYQKLYQSGIKDIRSHLADQESAKQAEKDAARAAQEAARAAEQARAQFTLATLCNAYVGHLEALGKPSAKDAACAFRVHVAGARPDLAKIPANEIQPEQIADLLRSIREKGKDRMAGVVRSYLNAAYQQAIGAKFDTGASASFNGFDVTQNPIAPIKAIRVKAGQRTLSAAELRDYLSRLECGIIDQALMLALLAGGQRMAQLLRARVGDWDADQRVLRLWDSKGKRETAREHLLPLGERASELVGALVERAREKVTQGGVDLNPSLWLSVGGATVVHSTPGKRVVEIAKVMGGESFDLRDIRRTVETQLAGLGISRDVRAQLLSHGLSGVQAVHYDRHGYMDEKRAALVAWEDHLLRREADNVVPIRQTA